MIVCTSCAPLGSNPERESPSAMLDEMSKRELERPLAVLAAQSKPGLQYSCVMLGKSVPKRRQKRVLEEEEKGGRVKGGRLREAVEERKENVRRESRGGERRRMLDCGRVRWLQRRRRRL